MGYDSVRYGLTGIESSMNAYLSGADLGTQGLIDKVLGRHSPGANVRLTIVPAVQKVAQSALGSQVGAIVALDPRTGAIIAAASAPSYNPATIDTSFARLSKNPDAPLLSRVTQGLYPPGSSFKVVTATAALNLGKVTPTTSFDDTGDVRHLRRQGHQLPRRGLRHARLHPGADQLGQHDLRQGGHADRPGRR